MSYDLISEEEYASLPVDDDERCFVEFENICRRNMLQMLDQSSSNDLDKEVRQQYMVVVAAVANACGVPNISYDPTAGGDFWIVFSQFSLAVQSEVTRIRIVLRKSNSSYSVLLTANTRTKIDHYIARIRDLVDKGDLDPDRKRRLNEKLDELAAELASQRLSFAKTMALLAGMMTALGAAVTISADGPQAVTHIINGVAHIMQLIGEDKDSEVAATKRLAPPAKALPAPRTKPPAPRHRSVQRATSLDGDDDIPF